jgi:hypothetical protein
MSYFKHVFAGVALAFFAVLAGSTASEACEPFHFLKPSPGSICYNDVCSDPFYAQYNPDLCGGVLCSPCDPSKYPPGTPLPELCDEAGGVCWTGDVCALIEKTSFQGGRWMMSKGSYTGPQTVPVGELVIDRVDVLSTNTRTGQKVQMSARATPDSGNPAGSVCPPAPELAGSDALSCNVVQYLIKHATKICPNGSTSGCPGSQQRLPIFNNFGDVEQLQRGVDVSIGTATIRHSRQKAPSFYFNICCSGLVGRAGDYIKEDGWYAMRDPSDLSGANCQHVKLREVAKSAGDFYPDSSDEPVSCQPIN